MSQVDVPITRTKVRGVISAPTAPMWQSNAPTETATLVVSPRRSAHSGVKVPTCVSLVYVFSNRWLRKPASLGSRAVRNSSVGSPPHFSSHMALCPAAQRLRYTSSGFVLPVIRAGSQSQCSIQAYASLQRLSSVRSTCAILAHTHSEE